MKFRIRSTKDGKQFFIYDADKLINDKRGNPVFEKINGTGYFASYYDASLVANQLRIKQWKEENARNKNQNVSC